MTVMPYGFCPAFECCINEIIEHLFLSVTSFIQHHVFEITHGFASKHSSFPLQCSIPLNESASTYLSVLSVVI